MVFFSFFSTFSLFFPFLVPVAPNQIYRSQSKARRERKWERACVNTTVQKSQSCLLHLFISSSCHPQPHVLFSLTFILLCLSSALTHFSFFVFNHVIGFSDLVDLWVIKIQKPMILCRRSTSCLVTRARNTDHTVRTCEMFVYLIVNRTRLYDYQTRRTHFVRNLRVTQRFVGFFFLILIGWADKLRSWQDIFSLEPVW